MVAFKKATGKKRPPRAKGEGSVFQRADGMWVGSVEAHDGDGKRRQRRVYSKDYRTLIDKLDELKSDSANGLKLDRSTTVAKWLDYWLPNIHKPRIRPTTYRDYEYTVNNINTAIGNRKLAELTPADIRRMHSILGKEERRTGKAHAILHKALRDAVAEGLVRRNVVDVVDPPTVISKKRRPLTIVEVHAILNYAAEHRNKMEYARWMLLFLTGLRQGESLGLTWDRVDTEGRVMEISWQLQQWKRAHGCGQETDAGWPCGHEYGGHCFNPVWDVPAKVEYQPLHRGLVLSRPKSEAGNRWVPMLPPLADALAKLRAADIGPNPHNLVFHRENGSPVYPGADSASWHAILREAGVIGLDETLPMHTTRHTAGTALRTAGVDEQTRMEILGHNSPEVTRVYAHADQARNSLMMDALMVLVPKELT